jgi:hypothetical protein
MLFCVAIAVFGIAGSLFALSTAFDSGITPKIALVASLSALCVSLILCTARFIESKRGGGEDLSLRLVFFSALFILALTFIFKKDCADAIMGLAETFVERIGMTFLYKADNRTENADYLVPACLYSTGTAIAIFYGVSLRKSLTALILLTFPIPIVLLCTGLFPAPLTICLPVAAVIGVAAYRASERIYTGFFALITAVICMSAVNLFAENFAVPYMQNHPIVKEEYGFNTITDSIRGESSPPQSYTAGAIRHGELAKVGKIRFSGKTVLRAQFPKTDNTIYLRGFIAYNYYDNKWNEISGEPLLNERGIAQRFSGKTLSPLLMDGANIKSENTYNFSVSDLTSNSDYIYLPYTITPQSGAKFLSADKTRFVYTLDSYGGSFYGGAGLEVYKRIFEFNKALTDEERSNDEKLYREFVYDNYLEVPDIFTGGEIVLTGDYKNFVGENADTEYDFTDQMNILSRKLYYIRSWLRENCAYDLDVGAVPEGEDFVNRFLTETRAGSCSHFASAAVLLCREAGIPARYVEGYVIKPKDFPSDAEDGENAFVDIADTRAHAWAEVYIDEFGWYPYEFTSGYGNIRTAVTEPTITTETTTAADLPSAPIITAATPSETTPPMTTERQIEEVIAQPEEAQKTASPLWLLLLIIPAAAMIIPLRRAAILKARANRENKLSNTVSVFYAYYEVLPILRHYGIAVGGIYTDFGAFARELEKSECAEAAIIIKAAVITAFGGFEPTKSDKTEVFAAMKKMKMKYYAELSKKQQLKEKYFRVFL